MYILNPAETMCMRVVLQCIHDTYSTCMGSGLVCVCAPHHSVFVHELNNDGGWGLQHLTGVAIDTDVLDEDGLVPGGADSLRDDTCFVTPRVERQNAVRICGNENQHSVTYMYIHTNGLYS